MPWDRYAAKVAATRMFRYSADPSANFVNASLVVLKTASFNRLAERISFYVIIFVRKFDSHNTEILR